MQLGVNKRGLIFKDNKITQPVIYMKKASENVKTSKMRARAICNLPSLHWRYMKNALVFSQSKLLNYYQVCYCSRYLVHFGINTHFINPFVEGFFAYLLFKGWNWAFIFIVVLLGGIFILLWCLFFICYMIIILDTVCFLIPFVLRSSQCSCLFLWALAENYDIVLRNKYLE